MKTRPAQRPGTGVTTTLGGFATVQEAWAGALSYLREEGAVAPGVTDPLSVGSGFGTRERRTREILAASFSILNPRHRLIASAARPIDLGYAIANVIWTIAGSSTWEKRIRTTIPSEASPME